MAANTAVNIPLQARDWELFFGLIFMSNDADIVELQLALSAIYRNPATKPALNTTIVTLASTEDVVFKIADQVVGKDFRYVSKDIGTSFANRVLTALRATNNVADNYISGRFATFDASIAAAVDAARVRGRQFIMAKQADNV